MRHYVVVILGLHIASAAPPVTLMIDCGSEERDPVPSFIKTKSSDAQQQSNTLCSIIHGVLPKTVKDGKFVLIGEPDQSRASNNQISTSVLPPKGFIPKLSPKFRTPKLKVPKLKVPRLQSAGPFQAPRVGAARFPSFKNRKEESSAERMEKLKNGMQKMLHVVKVLGQIDQYVSERTRAIVDVLSRTFSD